MGGGVGAVGAAGEHRDVGTRRRRAPRGGRPGRSRRRRPDTTGWPARHQGGGDAGGDLGAVGRGRAGPDDRDGAASSSSRGGPLTQSPSGGPPRWSSSSRPHQVVDLAWATRRRRGPRSGCPAGPPARGRASGSRPRSRAATSRALGRSGWRRVAERARAAATAPSWATSAGDPRVAGLGQPGRARPGPAGRRRSRRPPGRRPASSSSGSPWPQPERGVDVGARSGASPPRRSATVQASRWTRTAPRRLSRPVEHLVVQTGRGRRRAAATRGRAARSGTWEFSRHSRPAYRACWRSRAAATRSRTSSELSRWSPGSGPVAARSAAGRGAGCRSGRAPGR